MVGAGDGLARGMLGTYILISTHHTHTRLLQCGWFQDLFEK